MNLMKLVIVTHIGERESERERESHARAKTHFDVIQLSEEFENALYWIVQCG